MSADLEKTEKAKAKEAEELKKIQDLEKESEEKAKKIISDAKEKAEKIINDAKKEASNDSEEEETVKSPEQIKKENEKKRKTAELSKYEKFAELESLSLREGVQMKPEAIKELKQLRIEIKKGKGKKPNKSKTIPMGLGNGLVKIIKDYPVPELIYEKFEEKGIVDKYFD